MLTCLATGQASVGAGTTWLWARPEYRGAVDVLFVDEAGQMSLANVLAVAQAADSLVLLGDPQQLEQPQQGSHPEGTEVSALEHLLQDGQTIADECGLFLDETWRLHPEICVFTSELFYEGRLASRPGLETQALAGRRCSPTPGYGSSRWNTRGTRTPHPKRSMRSAAWSSRCWRVWIGSTPRAARRR